MKTANELIELGLEELIEHANEINVYKKMIKETLELKRLDLEHGLRKLKEVKIEEEDK